MGIESGLIIPIEETNPVLKSTEAEQAVARPNPDVIKAGALEMYDRIGDMLIDTTINDVEALSEEDGNGDPNVAVFYPGYTKEDFALLTQELKLIRSRYRVRAGFADKIVDDILTDGEKMGQLRKEIDDQINFKLSQQLRETPDPSTGIVSVRQEDYFVQTGPAKGLNINELKYLKKRLSQGSW